MTRLRRTLLAACAPLVALALALVAAAPAAATSAVLPLVEGTTGTALLSVPFPGHATPFDLTATGRPGSASDLVLLVDGGPGPLATGPHALQLVIADESGQVLAQGTAAELAAAPVPLGVIGDQPIRLTGTATLPAAAGNELQNQGMTLLLTLVASQDVPAATPVVPADRGELAITGASVLTLALVAACLVVLGFLLAARRRRRDDSTVLSTTLPE